MTGHNSINALLETPEPPDLGPGPRKGVDSESDLEVKLKTFFLERKLPIQQEQLVRALTLLWHDHLETAHGIAQDIETSDGSFVHAIMHRREPDYGNAKYWFRRVGKHPAYSPISAAVNDLLNADEHQGLHQQIVPGGEWDPFAFVDCCQQAARGPEGQRTLLRKVQQIETEALLNWILAR